MDFLAIKVRWGVFLVRPQISQTRDGTISILHSSRWTLGDGSLRYQGFFNNPRVGITKVPETDVYNSLIINGVFSLGPGISKKKYTNYQFFAGIMVFNLMWPLKCQVPG